LTADEERRFQTLRKQGRAVGEEAEAAAPKCEGLDLARAAIKISSPRSSQRLKLC
jgi:hypothetical protein